MEPKQEKEIARLINEGRLKKICSEPILNKCFDCGFHQSSKFNTCPACEGASKISLACKTCQASIETSGERKCKSIEQFIKIGQPFFTGELEKSKKLFPPIPPVILNCKKCGTPISGSLATKICNKCITLQTTQKEKSNRKKICESCGNNIASDATTCAFCSEYKISHSDEDEYLTELEFEPEPIDENIEEEPIYEDKETANPIQRNLRTLGRLNFYGSLVTMLYFLCIGFSSSDKFFLLHAFLNLFGMVAGWSILKLQNFWLIVFCVCVQIFSINCCCGLGLFLAVANFIFILPNKNLFKS